MSPLSRAIILALSLLASSVFGQTITSVTGDLDHGGSVVIGGSGFGVKSPAAPLKWETFESGSNDTQVELTQSEWISYQDGGARYSTTQAYSGSYSIANKVSYAEGGFATNYFDIGVTDTVFVSQKYRLEGINWGASDFQWKNTRIKDNTDGRAQSGPYHGYGFFQNDRINYRTYSAMHFQMETGGTVELDLRWGGWQESGWGGQELEFVLGAVGVADGTSNITMLFNGTSTSGQTYEGNSLNRTAQYEFKTVLLGLMHANLTAEYANFAAYIDDVYIDDTRARVFIGNSNTVANCGIREMQLPTAWAGGSITVTVNTGAFADSTNAYLYVVESDGTPSNAFTITIGEAGGGGVSGITAPPDSLTASGGN